MATKGQETNGQTELHTIHQVNHKLWELEQLAKSHGLDVDVMQRCTRECLLSISGLNMTGPLQALDNKMEDPWNACQQALRTTRVEYNRLQQERTYQKAIIS